MSLQVSERLVQTDSQFESREPESRQPPGNRRVGSPPTRDKHLLAIREKIWTCIRALRALEKSELAGQARLHRRGRLVEDLSYWLRRQSKMRSDRNAALARQRPVPAPAAAPSQIQVRRFGPSSHERPVEPDRTRFTSDSPATWFSV